MAMKIYFCDVCNESVPQDDLEKNRVTMVRGKMICAKCVPPPGSAPAPAAVASGPAAGGSGGLLVALVGLIVGGAGLLMAMQARSRIDALPDLAPRLEDLARTCDRLLQDSSASGKRLDAAVASLAKLEGEPAALRESLAEQLHRIENEERAMQEMRTLLGSLRSDRELVQRLELMQGRFEHELAEVKGTVQEITSRVAAIGSLPAPSADGAAPGAPAADEGPAFDAETKKLIADLSSKDPSARWSAVDRLAKKHDAKLVPALLPLLEDADAFVQFRVISTLRDLNARGAVGRLIKLLRDGDAIVREEALDALVTLTGNPLRPVEFATATPAEREKVVKAWEEWFEKNKERFAEPTASS